MLNIGLQFFAHKKGGGKVRFERKGRDRKIASVYAVES